LISGYWREIFQLISGYWREMFQLVSGVVPEYGDDVERVSATRCARLQYI